MTGDPTWVPGAAGSGFGSDHLPYGRFRHSGSTSAGVRIGDFALDLTALSVGTEHAGLFEAGELKPLLSAGPARWAAVREWCQAVLTTPAAPGNAGTLLPLDSVEPLLPIEIADYVDFYASLDHATNVGRMFRPDGDALLPNWRHLPVSYHGRAGTVIASGTPVRRPKGQFMAAPDSSPVFGPARKLDIEAELGFIVGVESAQGEPVGVDEFDARVFGVVGLNDWSARDIQAWEYVPLGPNLSKSFATSISAWITPLSALEHARIPLPRQEPTPLPHLLSPNLFGLDIEVTVTIGGEVVSRPPYASMYWSPAQMLAHMVSNGASLRTGDLFGSGTISGPRREERGSLLELSWNGTEPWYLGQSLRTFLEDGDEVVLDFRAQGRYDHITLGEVRASILPATS